MGLVEIFKKKGGKKVLRQWILQGTFHTALAEFLLLGKSKKALELLREVTAFKHKENLVKNYATALHSLPESYQLEHIANHQVWVLWWQGIENAPKIVNRCYESVLEAFKEWKITLLTEQNWNNYVTLPDDILDKFRKGVIPMAQFSDLLRLQLLIEHGGLWIDATVYISSGNTPPPHPLLNVCNSDLFMFQKEGGGFSNWLIWSKTNNDILIGVRDLLFDYWRRNKKMTDYFIFHRFLELVCERYKEQASHIPFYNNSTPHILLLHLFDLYDETYWEDLKKQTGVHKLSYRLDEDKLSHKGTYYDEIINK